MVRTLENDDWKIIEVYQMKCFKRVLRINRYDKVNNVEVSR